ncbi:MAG: phosphatidate cytidylyltransferase [Rhodospirillales bacterium]
MKSAKNSGRFPKLGARLISAVVLGGIAFAAAWYGYPWFDLLIAIGATLALFEWYRLCNGWRRPFWVLLGVLYLAATVLSLFWLRHEPEWGRATMLWLMACVVAVDSGAYFAGRMIGGPKLVPLISPQKTWAGLGGGIVASALVGLIAAIILQMNVLPVVLWSALLAPIAQFGDILESAVKRYFGVKDSGSIIPGHGGILDRIDGLMMAAIVVALLRVLSKSVLPWP